MDHEATAPHRILASAVAPRLGYTIVASDATHYTAIEGDNEVCLFWRSPWRPKHRIEISGLFPRWGEHRELTFCPSKVAAITIAATSTVEHAEREIRHRLLPKYLLQLEQAKSQRAEFLAQTQSQHRTVDALQAAGAQPTSRVGRLALKMIEPPDDRWPRGDIEVSYDGQAVGLELHDLSPEQAVAVLRTLTNLDNQVHCT